MTRRPFLVLIAAVASLSAPASETALDRYVAAPDPSYGYELVDTVENDGFTTYTLDMVSQTWRSPKEVDRPVWRHWLTIVRPAQVKKNVGFLFITGGGNGSKPPAQPDGLLRDLAVDTGTVVAELRMVPNQPIVFAGESKGRSEDSLIAWTWDKYLRGGDENWPARLPMTKAVVRAMDTITDFCANGEGGKVNVSRFVVSGASKRGWTTWTTAAVDKRVIGIIPIVIDLLNVEPSFQHHWQVYGFWAPAIADYQNMRITDWTGHPRYRELMKIEEPFEYRERLTMPKFLINATGDQFFLPDSWRFYWDDLKGEKYLRYVPNADHSLRRTDAAHSLHAYYDSLINGHPRPKFTWSVEKNGTIRVNTQTTPTAVKLWQATNTKARDFRLEKIGPAWKATDLQPNGSGIYEARVAAPPEGWTAYMVELTFPGGGRYPFRFTTGVNVTPGALPHPPYQPKRP